MTVAGNTTRSRTRSKNRLLRAGVAVTTAALTLTIGLGGTQAAEAGPRFHPGAPGVGDPYFPLLGNGGYDVGRYTLDLSYDPGRRWLAGSATIAAKATQDLSRFDLALSGMTVHRVTVNNVAATWTRTGDELRITPRSGLFRGQAFTVAVTYGENAVLASSVDDAIKNLLAGTTPTTTEPGGPTTPSSC